MSAFPIVLNAPRLAALVVGGGAVATRKALALAEAGAAVRVVAPAVAPPLRDAALAGALPLRLDDRPFAEADVEGSHLVLAATDRRYVNARVAAAAAARGVLCNVADDPEVSGFWTAAVHRAGPVVVAVSAGGVPSAATRIRDAIAGRLDERYADAVRALAALRARLLADGDARRWREATEALIGDDFVATVEAGTFAERVDRWG